MWLEAPRLIINNAPVNSSFRNPCHVIDAREEYKGKPVYSKKKSGDVYCGACGVKVEVWSKKALK